MKKTTLAVLVVLLIAPFISAVGVASSYWDDKPLKLAPGESTTISLRLQNEETYPVTMEVKVNSDIASLADGDTYEVPPGRVSVPVYFDISIPKNTPIGTGYNIYASFKQISAGTGEGGFFQVAQGITSKVPVEIVGDQESELYGTKQGLGTGWVIAIIAIIGLVSLVFILRNRGSR